MSYADLVKARRRLAVLRILRDAPMYTAVETVLRDALAAIGMATAREDLRADLRHLEGADCLVSQHPGGVWVATLTGRGADVAAGLAVAEGVDTLRPGETL